VSNYKKAKQVIASCETRAQLRCASRYVTLAKQEHTLGGYMSIQSCIIGLKEALDSEYMSTDEIANMSLGVSHA